MLLKLRLYDLLIKRGCPFPAGVSWAMPERMEPVRELYCRDLLDDWDYSYVCIDHHVLEATAQRDGQVVLNVGNENWGPGSPGVVYIVLDKSKLDASLLFALQILMRLDFPLLSRREVFLMSALGDPQDLEMRTFLRNEAQIDIFEGCKRIVLVVTSGEASVRIADANVPVTTTLREGLVPPLAAVNATAMIRRCCRVMAGLDTSLSTVVADWVKDRVGGRGVDWSEIDLLASLLVCRFMPGAEVVRGVDGTSRSTGIPPGYLLEELGTHVIPAVVPGQRHDIYYHTQGVTALDQVVCDRMTARETPVVYLGNWSNVAELGCGFGLYQFVPEERTLCPGIQGRGSWVEILKRGLYLRRLVEESKLAAGVADPVCCPHVFPRVREHWSTIVRGKGRDDPTALSTLAHDLLGCVGGDSLSWEINLVHETVATGTGIRTPVSLWLTDCTVAAPPIENQEGYVLVSDMGDSWLNGRCAQTGMDLEAPRLERILRRVDVMAVTREDLGYCTRPDMTQCYDLAARIDSMAFGILGIQRGWGGCFRSVGATNRPPRASGWLVRTSVKDWTVLEYRTPAISAGLLSAMMAPIPGPEVVFRTIPGQVVFKGTGPQFIHREQGLRTRVGRGGDLARGAHAGQSQSDFHDAPREVDPGPADPAVVAGPAAESVAKAGGDAARAEYSADHRERSDET